MLATQGKHVSAVAADGAARVIIRIPANSAGEVLQLTLLDENGSAGQADLGSLSTVNGTEKTGSLQVTADIANGHPMAFGFIIRPLIFLGGAQTMAPRADQSSCKPSHWRQ